MTTKQQAALADAVIASVKIIIAPMTARVIAAELRTQELAQRVIALEQRTSAREGDAA